MASNLDAVLRDLLAEVAERLRALDRTGAVRWVDVSGIHLTLRFLGEVPPGRLDLLRATLERAVTGLPAPHVALRGLGAFPDARRPRVLWVGVQDAGGRLAALQKAVERAVVSLGWPPEGRPFQPHLTVGRVRDAEHGAVDRQLLDALGRDELPDVEARPQTNLVLYRSHLERGGARYEPIATWSLPESVSR